MGLRGGPARRLGDGLARMGRQSGVGVGADMRVRTNVYLCPPAGHSKVIS